MERVWRTAIFIREKEGAGDLLTIELAALLHDISDAKFNGGDEEKGSRIAGEFLLEQGVSQERIDHIQSIIKHVSYKGGFPHRRPQGGKTPLFNPLVYHNIYDHFKYIWRSPFLIYGIIDNF